MNVPMLAVKELSVAFDGVTVIDKVSFTLRARETLALVGESGSGKSVSALSILRLLHYPPASHPSGQILFEGRDLLNADLRTLRQIRGHDISMIFQEPMTSLNPLHTVEKQIGEILELHQGLRRPRARTRIVELLEKVGIAQAQSRLQDFPHQLSGGQRQRVMIAMALANRPKILIADEPTTALDVTVQAQILKLLKDLQAELGMALLLITHDLGIVKTMADNVCVMKGGRIVESSPVAELFSHPQHDYTKMLLAAAPKGRPAPADPAAPIIVSTKGLKVWFPVRRGFFKRRVGYIKAVDGLDLTLREGQTLGLVGESGSGKTTCGLAILRLIAAQGEITCCGQRIDGWHNRQMRPLRKNMQVVFQDPYGSLSPRMSILQIVEEGLAVQNPSLKAKERRARVAEALTEVELAPELMHRYPHEFSGGQRQRIAIARALVLKPRFIMLDEPTSALDMSVQAQVVELLRHLQARHKLAYLFISHDLRVVRALAHEVIVMRNGKVVEQASADEIFTAPKEQYTKALLAAALSHKADETVTRQ